MSRAHGYPIAVWERAKAQAKAFLRLRARQQRPVFYAGLCRELRPIIDLDYHSADMNEFLDQISREEEAAGRGMLSAFVIRQEEPGPGSGFFLCAKALGRPIINEIDFWVEEMRRVSEANQ